MARRCASPVVRPWVVGVVLCTTALILLAGAAPHAHVAGNSDDCAVCKASHTVATLEPVALVRQAADGAPVGPPPCRITAEAFRPSSAGGPRAPPAL